MLLDIPQMRSIICGVNVFSNAIGPLIGIWILATTGEINSKVSTPIGILVYGGLGISVGLWIWGRRVIETVGKDLSTITPSRLVQLRISWCYCFKVCNRCLTMYQKQTLHFTFLLGQACFVNVSKCRAW